MSATKEKVNKYVEKLNLIVDFKWNVEILQDFLRLGDRLKKISWSYLIYVVILVMHLNHWDKFSYF